MVVVSLIIGLLVALLEARSLSLVEPKDSRSNLAVVRQYAIDFAWISCSPDGITRRCVGVGLNGDAPCFPGPLIYANEGDVLNVTFTNRLIGLNSEESSAIHWHGLLQRGTNNMDGAALITQTLTPPDTSRIYTFMADVAGSYWYHAHWRGREVDGASGPLVVYKQSPTFSQYPTIPSFLDDTVVWLKDWYRYDSETLTAKYLNKSNAIGIEPVPFTGLINGVGQSDSTSLQYASINLTRAVACVPQPGNKYVFPINTPLSKLRLITGSSFGVFTLTVENHLISIVQVGPSPVKPTDAMSSILVNAGERFDIVICRIPFRPGSDHPSLYDLHAPVYIQTTLVQSVFGESSPFPNTTAILSYKAYAGPHLTPSTTRPISSGQSTLLFDQNVGDQINLKPSISNLNNSIPLLVTVPSTKVFTLTLNFAETTDHGALPGSDIGDSLTLPTIGINNQTPVNWEYPPVLKNTSLYDLWSANKPFPPASEGRTNNWGINYINISQGDVVDIVVNNHDGGQHPLHLHGHTFYVMRQGPWNTATDPIDSPFSTADQIKLDDCSSNFSCIPLDTVTVNPLSYIVLRFEASNPGVWFFHCHLDWHLAAGLAIVFRYNNPPSSSSPPPEDNEPDERIEDLIDTYTLVLGLIFLGFVIIGCLIWLCCIPQGLRRWLRSLRAASYEPVASAQPKDIDIQIIRKAQFLGNLRESLNDSDGQYAKASHLLSCDKHDSANLSSQFSNVFTIDDLDNAQEDLEKAPLWPDKQ